MIRVNNLVLLAVMPLIVSGSLYANTFSDIHVEMHQCAKVIDNNKRLACFDSITETLSSKKADLSELSVNSKNTKSSHKAKEIDEVTVTKALKEPAVLTKAQKSKQEEDFAQAANTKLVKPEVTSIVLIIEKLSKTLRGQWKITFTNGQVWQQKDSTRLSLKAEQRVKLTKGALGSYYLKKVGSKKSIQVKRLK